MLYFFRSWHVPTYLLTKPTSGQYNEGRELDTMVQRQTGCVTHRWYELGQALSLSKPQFFICGSKRPTPPPSIHHLEML